MDRRHRRGWLCRDPRPPADRRVRWERPRLDARWRHLDGDSADRGVQRPKPSRAPDRGHGGRHPADGAPRAATPAATGRAGAWRHGPSVGFVLSEVRAADAVYFGDFPVPRPTVERGPVQAQETDLPGFTGVRVLVRATAIGPDAPPNREAPTLDHFLHDAVATRERIGVARIPVPAGAESGRDGSFVRLPLGDVELPDGLPPSRWIVTIAQINDWGEIAGPVRQTIELDADGPSLVIEIPFLSAPWPLEATIHGRSEPQISVLGGSAGTVATDRRGRFELRTQLAPWPQTLELTAVDETGNRTIRRFTVVGGVDYRSFPWAAILAVALLVGAILSTGRGISTTRRGRNDARCRAVAGDRGAADGKGVAPRLANVAVKRIVPSRCTSHASTDRARGPRHARPRCIRAASAGQDLVRTAVRARRAAPGRRVSAPSRDVWRLGVVPSCPGVRLASRAPPRSRTGHDWCGGL